MSDIIKENENETNEFLAAIDSLDNEPHDKKVEGTVLHIMPNEIQVDVGRKQTGIIPIEEYSNDPTADPSAELQPGDKITCIIMKTNDAEGTILLSKRLYDSAKNWDIIADASENNTVLTGKVKEIVKGGVVVYVSGVRIFVPASQATLYKPEDVDAALEELRGQDVNLKIIDIKERGHRKEAVGSIRAVLREEKNALKDQFWSEIEVGKKYTGTVKSVTDFGCFVDLGATDGLVHRSELSWQRFKHPSDVVSVGDVLDVYVKSYDPEKKKVSLGYKKIEDNPWEILKRDYPVGTVCDVTIANLATFGAFARIIPGIDGLIYIGEITDHRINEPAEVLAVGDVVKAMITEIDFDKKRISLSCRKLMETEAPAEPEYDEPEEYDDTPKAIPIDEFVVSDED